MVRDSEVEDDFYIETLEDVDLRETGSNGLKQMATRNVVRWSSQIPYAWEGLKPDEKDGREVASFNFDKLESDEDNAVSSFIVATVKQFNLTSEDIEQARESFTQHIRNEIESVRDEIEDLREQDLTEEQEKKLEEYESRLEAQEQKQELIEEDSDGKTGTGQGDTE